MKLFLPLVVPLLTLSGECSAMYITDPLVVPWMDLSKRVAAFGVVNNGDKPVNVVTWFNETVPTDHTAEPAPGGGFPYPSTRSGTFKEQVALGVKEVLGQGSPDALPRLYLRLTRDQELPIQKIQKIQNCIEDDSDNDKCSYVRRTARSKKCVPKVRIMKFIRIVKIDYSNVVEDCSASDIEDDVNYISTQFNVDGAEAGKRETLLTTDEVSEEEAEEAQIRLVESLRNMTSLNDAASPEVDFAMDPNDKFYDYQWHLRKYKLERFFEVTHGLNGQQTHAPTITIINHGVWRRHPDLQDNLWVNRAELNGKKGVDDDNNGYIDDIYGWTAGYVGMDPTPSLPGRREGIMTAGIISAVTHNEIGIASVGQNTLKLAVCNWGLEDSSDNIAECIDWAISIKSRVTLHMNAQWSSTKQTPNMILKAAYDALNEAEILAVINAGSSGKSLGPRNHEGYVYPACYNYPNFVSVAAITEDEKLMPESNYGENCITLGAPGNNITTLADPAYTRDGSFAVERRDATPAEVTQVLYRITHYPGHAAAYVAGIAGLMVRGVPTMRAYDIKHIFRFATQRVSSLARPVTLYGGVLDVSKVVALTFGYCTEEAPTFWQGTRGEFANKRRNLPPNGRWAYPWGLPVAPDQGFPQAGNGTIVFWDVNENYDILDRTRVFFGYDETKKYSFLREGEHWCPQ